MAAAVAKKTPDYRWRRRLLSRCDEVPWRVWWARGRRHGPAHHIIPNFPYFAAWIGKKQYKSSCSRVCFDFLPFSVWRDFLKLFFSSQEFSKTKKLVKIMNEKIKTNSWTGQFILIFTNPCVQQQCAQVTNTWDPRTGTWDSSVWQAWKIGRWKAC